MLHKALLVLYSCGLGKKTPNYSIPYTEKLHQLSVIKSYFQKRHKSKNQSYTNHAHFKLLHKYKLASLCKKIYKQNSVSL